MASGPHPYAMHELLDELPAHWKPYDREYGWQRDKGGWLDRFYQEKEQHHESRTYPYHLTLRHTPLLNWYVKFIYDEQVDPTWVREHAWSVVDQDQEGSIIYVWDNPYQAMHDIDQWLSSG